MVMRHLGLRRQHDRARRASGGRGAARLYAHDDSRANRRATFVAIYEFDGYRPVVHESAFVHPLAAVTGNVVIGRDVYVGPGAAIRGDWGEILISDGCNVQENCVIHVFPGATV